MQPVVEEPVPPAGGMHHTGSVRLTVAQAVMNSRDLATVSRREGRPAELLLREHLERRVPARRLGTPDEVAGLFAFLASDEAAFITGEVIRIDGGELAG